MNEGGPSNAPALAPDLLLALTGAATLAVGAMLYGAGTAQLTTLAPGSVGQVLALGAGPVPTWTDTFTTPKTISRSTAGVDNLLSLRNSNAGVTAATQFILGNDAATSVGYFFATSSTYTSGFGGASSMNFGSSGNVGILAGNILRASILSSGEMAIGGSLATAGNGMLQVAGDFRTTGRNNRLGSVNGLSVGWSSTDYADIAYNVTRDATATQTYTSNDSAKRLYFGSLLRFQVAASGTTGNPITWASALSINGASEIGIGVDPTAGNGLLQVGAASSTGKANGLAFATDTFLSRTGARILTLGDQTGSTVFRVDGAGSGTNGGSYFGAYTGGTYQVLFGNKSALLGGAFDPDALILVRGSLTVQTNAGTNALTIDTSQNSTFAGKVTSNSTAAGALTATGDIYLLKAANTDAQFLIQVSGYGSILYGCNNSGSTNSAGAASGSAYVGPAGSIPLALVTGGSTRLNVSGNAFTFNDGATLSFGTSTGIQIGTGTTQKIGFWNATPVVRPTLAAAATDAATTQTLANSLRTALINMGLGA